MPPVASLVARARAALVRAASCAVTTVRLLHDTTQQLSRVPLAASLTTSNYWAEVHHIVGTSGGEICRGASNYQIDLSRQWAEVHCIVGTCGGPIAA